jgi:O-antigen/teichoic acid export membrane protein
MAAVLVTAGFAEVLVPLVAGEEYASLASSVWLFAALGATLAVDQVLVYARLAVSDRRLGAMAWGVTAVVCVVVLTRPDPSLTDVVSTVLVGALVLAVTGLVTEWMALRRAEPSLDAL